jgi:predicted ArsR family transcriptional regulator
MCRLEEQMISEALGQPVHLSSCRLDGDACCQFSAVPAELPTAGAS